MGLKTGLPGLFSEPLPSGGRRWRVRVKGNKGRKITVPAPDEPGFAEAYEAARQGIRWEPALPAETSAIPRSVDWLTHKFETHMLAQVEAGLMHPGTLRQRQGFLSRLRDRHGKMRMAMPSRAVIEMRDEMAKTPGAADNFVKTVRACYAWAVERGHVKENPAAGIGKINRGKGAVPWSVEDLKRYRERHSLGTSAHLALTLLMFTACRIGDLHHLGRHHEVTVGGVRCLRWQPSKRGSEIVTVPILPPLARAIEARTVIGQTYLLTAHGKPFPSGAAMGGRFRDWCDQADLQGRSAHGIRKAVGSLLAEHGLSQYHVMAIHGHTQAKTSEIYTAGADRARLGIEAMQALAGMEW